jgi:uncharacterized protein YndB with AHSA1/START domain
MAFIATASVEVRRPLASVWRALTEPQLVKQYFFGTELVTSWTVGSPIVFRGEWEGAAYEDKGLVLAYEPERYLRYSYLSSWSELEDKPENYQHINYRTTATATGTKVTIEQEGIPTAEQRDHSALNWSGVLAELKRFLEA